MISRVLYESGVVVVMLLAIAFVEELLPDGAGAYGAESPRAGVCAAWDDAASDSITRLAQAGDVDLRLVGDAIVRMRRARRSCHMGFIRSACLDYHAIMRGSPGLRDWWLPSSFECSFPDGELAGNIINSLSWR
jgi:hypothetical protein